MILAFTIGIFVDGSPSINFLKACYSTLMDVNLNHVNWKNWIGIYGTKHSRMDQVKFAQILLGPFLNALTHLPIYLTKPNALLIWDSKAFINIFQNAELELYNKVNKETLLNANCHLKPVIKRMKTREFAMECCLLLSQLTLFQGSRERL